MQCNHICRPHRYGNSFFRQDPFSSLKGTIHIVFEHIPKRIHATLSDSARLFFALFAACTVLSTAHDSCDQTAIDYLSCPLLSTLPLWALCCFWKSLAAFFDKHHPPATKQYCQFRVRPAKFKVFHALSLPSQIVLKVLYTADILLHLRSYHYLSKSSFCKSPNFQRIFCSILTVSVCSLGCF